MLAQLCALRTHDVRALFSLERLSSAALFQETMVCSLGNKKKNPAHNAPPFCTRISAECSTPASGTTPPHKHTHIKHGASHFPGTGAVSPLLQHCLCLVLFFLSSIFSIRRRVSVMKGSVLIQDKEIMRWPSEDYKTMLLLMS